MRIIILFQMLLVKQKQKNLLSFVLYWQDVNFAYILNDTISINSKPISNNGTKLMVLKFIVKRLYKCDNKANRVESYCKYIKILNLRLLFTLGEKG